MSEVQQEILSNLLNLCEVSNVSSKRPKHDYLNRNSSSVIRLPSVSHTKSAIYQSIHNKTKEVANAYAKTDQFSHRYLAYRDIPKFIKKYTKGKQALDYGTGTGISASFLHNLGMDVVGTDICPLMLEKARETQPNLPFFEITHLMPNEQFDLVFSSFVLFDIKSKNDIVDYLMKAASFMKKNATFIAITGSEELYSVSRNWIAYDSNFDENRNLKSGDVTKLRLQDPAIEFSDYFWQERDYCDCIQEAGLKILDIHKPLGFESDPFLWKDEKLFSPFTAYILAKN